MPFTSEHLAEHDRINERDKVVYTSPKPGVPPVPTLMWDDSDWEIWHQACARVHNLMRDAEAAGYRVVAF